MSDPVKDSIALLSDGHSVPQTMLQAAFEDILSGNSDPVLISAFLMGLRCKGETAEDIEAGARIMRQHARRIDAPDKAVDTCGTGGLPFVTLNTSTASAFVTAGAGGLVAKHGNRSVPPKTGSADVLEALGVNLTPSEDQVREAFSKARVAFLFAQAHHSAMRHVGPVRKTLALRTIFNLLGPLSNPAGTKRQVIGTFSPVWQEPFAQVLQRLGSERAMIVHGEDGLDEISVSGPTRIVELTASGEITSYTVTPRDVGLEEFSIEDIKGGSPEANAQAIRDLLDGAPGAFRDIVCFNAAAALVISDIAEDLPQGVKMAQSSIDSGAARAALETLVSITTQDPAA